jgi:cell division protein FtsI (penicillin-binding protein 3)
MKQQAFNLNIFIPLYFMILAFAGCNDTEINIPNKVECDLVKQAYHKLPTNNIYDGYKVATSIDTAIQAISEKCLMQNLKNLNAEYGCVIVMETSTGKINALVNLSKTDSLTYENQLNNAVCSTIEPGSLFHIYDVMQLLEDNYVDTNTVVEYKGKYIFNGNTVTDNHILDLDSISLSNAFVYSSKTVFAKAINTYYGKNPVFFQKDFQKLGFHKKLDIPFDNQGISKISTPLDKYWSNNSLIYQSIGYEISISPFQILTFYNAIANHGEMVKPLFLSQITNEKGQKKVYKKEVLQPKICSDKTLNKLQALLEKTVSEGSSNCAYSSKIKIAGKQATLIDLKAADQNTNDYYSAFVGYFPSDKPKYTAIVVVYKPSDFYYGISGRIFTEIANRLNIN